MKFCFTLFYLPFDRFFISSEVVTCMSFYRKPIEAMRPYFQVYIILISNTISFSTFSLPHNLKQSREILFERILHFTDCPKEA